ncbi:hypothetical protein JCM17823_05610 [Halorubrum gandharaense]
MSFRKPWRDLDRRTVGGAPNRYACYELGDGDGNSVGFGAGVLRDELKEVLAYGDAEQVRWELAESAEHAERILAEQTDDG